MAQKKRSNNNIFSSYISPPIPKTQQVVSESKVRTDLMVTDSYNGECRRGTKSRWFATTWWWPAHMMGTLTWRGDY